MTAACYGTGFAAIEAKITKLFGMKHTPPTRRLAQVLGTLAACLLIAFQQPAAAQSLDEDNGFMDIQLASERDSLITIMAQRRGKYQKLMRYDLLPEFSTFEDMEFKQVRLFYWDNQLHSIEVKAMGDNGNALRKWIMNRYGEGEKKDAMGYSYQWDGDKVLLLFEQNLVTKDVLLTFRHRDVHKQYYKFRYIQTYGN